MRRYEMALVASPNVSAEDHDKQLTTFEQLIADMGGVVHKVVRWGRRKLAYPIGKFHEGDYTLFLYDGAPEVEREFIRRVKLSDTFIRFLSVRADHEKPPTAEEKAALEQARRDYLVRAQERAAQGLGPDDDLVVPGVVPALAGGIAPDDEGGADDDFGLDDDFGADREGGR